MKAVVQRVSRAGVSVEGRKVAEIGRGLVVLLGVERGDTEKEADWIAEKIVNLRIFPAEGPEGEHKNMDRSLLDAGGAILAVSQFTLAGDCRKGRRPSFVRAAPPEEAEPLYEKFVGACRACGVQVETGKFRAMMDVELVNDGPVTIWVETKG